MALTITQQFQQLITRANNILLCFSASSGAVSGGNFSADAVASALALGKFLSLSAFAANNLHQASVDKPPHKRVNIVSDGFKVSKELSFLTGINEIKDKLTNLRQFIISLNIKDKKIDEFSYNVKDNKLMIYVLPEQGGFSPEDVVMANAAYRYHLIISLDTPDLESLGKIYLEQPEFFFKTPIINIDHNPTNENYGQLNLIDLTATSVTEVIYHLIKEIDEHLIDETIATLLLAGIISKTQSFKTPRLRPQTLQAASDLINKGADREKIVANFYRTKTLPTLKLWGRVLVRLQQDRPLKLVWSVLPWIDFVKSGASEEDIRGVVEEMISNSPDAEIILLLYEKLDGNIGGQFYAPFNYDARYLLNSFEISGSKNFVTFVLKGKTLREAEAEVVEEIRKKLEIRN